MPTERMEVEVVCPIRHDNPGAPVQWQCYVCKQVESGPAGTFTAPVAPGSLTEARLRLADAAEAWWMANEADHSREWATLLGALAALRTARGEG